MESDLRLALADFVLMSFPQPLLVLDENECIVESNRAAAGRTELHELFDPAARCDAVEVFLAELRVTGRASAALGTSSGAIELEGFAVDGWFIVTVQDIAQRSELERELHVLRSRASLALVAATLVHDFNNVLAPILLSSSRLVDEVDKDSPAGMIAGEIHSAASLGTSLMRDVLSLSRPRAKVIERVTVNDVIAERLGLIARLLGDSVEIECALDAAAGDVLVDRQRLEHALLNLATNARHAMPGGGRLTIVTRLVNASDGPCVLLIVSDTGAGMSDDVRRRAFDSFFTTKGETGGTGIGLASVLRFARDSGGHVTLDSELTKGTTVTVSLPRLAATEPVAAVEPRAHVTNGHAAARALEEDAF